MNARERRQKDCFEKNGVLIIVSLLAHTHTWSRKMEIIPVQLPRKMSEDLNVIYLGRFYFN